MTHDPNAGFDPDPVAPTANETAAAGHALDEKTRKMRSGDLVISPVMMVLSLYFTVESLFMIADTTSSGVSTIATSPGLFPALIGFLIFCCSGWVFWNALRSRVGYWFLKPEVIRAYLSRWDSWQPAVVIAMFVAYVFVLIGWLPFLVATALFGITMMAVFRAAKPWVIVAIVIPYVVFVGYAFTRFAATSFPNDPIISWLIDLTS